MKSIVTILAFILLACGNEIPLFEGNLDRGAYEITYFPQGADSCDLGKFSVTVDVPFKVSECDYDILHELESGAVVSAMSCESLLEFSSLRASSDTTFTGSSRVTLYDTDGSFACSSVFNVRGKKLDK